MAKFTCNNMERILTNTVINTLTLRNGKCYPYAQWRSKSFCCEGGGGRPWVCCPSQPSTCTMLPTHPPPTPQLSSIPCLGIRSMFRHLLCLALYLINGRRRLGVHLDIILWAISNMSLLKISVCGDAIGFWRVYRLTHLSLRLMLIRHMLPFRVASVSSL